MFGKHKADVLVVGAGPVGLFAAHILTGRGVHTEIFDRNRRTARRSQAILLHPQTIRLLDEAGLAKQLLAEGREIRKISFYDQGVRKAEIDLSRLRGPHSYALSLPQENLEASIQESLHRSKVPIRWDHRVSDVVADGELLKVTIDKLDQVTIGYAVAHNEKMVTKTLHSKVPFVVGADGYHSRIRSLLDTDYEQYGAPMRFLTVETLRPEGMDDELRVFIDEDSVNCALPVGADRLQWSFELEMEYSSDPWPELAQRLIESRAPWFQGEIDLQPWHLISLFDRRLVKRFGKDRIWLAGNAAHLTYPIGSQSVNVGLQEARELGEAIARCLRTQADTRCMESYSTHREEMWKSLLGTERRLLTTEKTDPWIAEHREQILGSIPASGQDLIEGLGQLDLEMNDHGLALV